MRPRTHCTNGHALVGVNVLVRVKRGRELRTCRLCRREVDARVRARRAAGLPPRRGNYWRGARPISRPSLLAGLIELGYSIEAVARWARVKEERLKQALELAALEVRL